MSNFTFPNTSIQATAASVCGGNLNCLFDIAATMLPGFGQNTLDSLNAFEEERAITGRNVFLGSISMMVYEIKIRNTP